MRSRISFQDKNLIEKGFTLVELLVVIVILGVLAAVVVFAVGGITNTSKSSACQIEVRTVNTATQAYYAEKMRIRPPRRRRRVRARPVPRSSLPADRQRSQPPVVGNRCVFGPDRDARNVFGNDGRLRFDSLLVGTSSHCSVHP